MWRGWRQEGDTVGREGKVKSTRTRTRMRTSRRWERKALPSSTGWLRKLEHQRVGGVVSRERNYRSDRTGDDACIRRTGGESLSTASVAHYIGCIGAVTFGVASEQASQEGANG